MLMAKIRVNKEKIINYSIILHFYLKIQWLLANIE